MLKVMKISRTDTSGKYLFKQFIQWVLFALLIAVCFVMETAGSSVKPLLLIPLALCISAHTGEIQSATVGTVCGLLLDVACNQLIGYHAIGLLMACVVVSLLHGYFLRNRFMNMFWLTAIYTMAEGYVDFLLYYSIWGLEDVNLIYMNIFLPSGIMTIISMIPIYLLVKWIAEICGSRRNYELEKTIIHF